MGFMGLLEMLWFIYEKTVINVRKVISLANLLHWNIYNQTRSRLLIVAMIGHKLSSKDQLKRARDAYDVNVFLHITLLGQYLNDVLLFITESLWAFYAPFVNLDACAGCSNETCSSFDSLISLYYINNRNVLQGVLYC